MSYNTMENILEAMLVVICLVTSAFPLWYGFANRWWTTRAGKAIFWLSFSLAAAWDLTAYLHFWPPDASDLDFYFWTQCVVMAITIVAGVYILYALWYNRSHGTMVTIQTQGEEKEEANDRRTRRDHS